MIMTPLQPIKKKDFIGRQHELSLLEEISGADEASIIIIYGRRRIGKTETIEQAYRQRNLLKFEGIEGEDQQWQREHVLSQLANYTGEVVLSRIVPKNWTEVFEILSKYIKEGTWTLYFEEVQWLASYETTFISELKYVWDNIFRHHKKLKLILCGSSPSFMINNVMHSKALYNRSMYEIAMKPFTLVEVQEFLKKHSHREIMDAYLTVGGIPEYLKRIKKSSSLLLGICKNAFSKNGYFVDEYKRIFISSMKENKYYEKIIAFLSRRKFATRKEIAKHLKVSSSGLLTEVLVDLEVCELIERYVPYNAKSRSILCRYCIRDNYLGFYYKFIDPIKAEIQHGDYHENPSEALSMASYQKWLGFSFERFCRRNHRQIAKILGFNAVRYQSGSCFNRQITTESPGFQIDLLFERADKVITFCEMKYVQGKVGTDIIEEMERKIELFNPAKKFTIHKVLITTEGASDALISRHYFDRVITLDEFF